MSEPYQQVCVRIPQSMYHQARHMVLMYQVPGGLTRLLRDGLEAQLAALAKQDPTFLVVWRMGHAGVDPSWHERISCYGGRVPEKHMTEAGQLFTLTELENHFVRGIWTRRTAELIHEQRRLYQAQGVRVYKPLLYPPGWDGLLREIQEREAAVNQALGVQEALEDPDAIV